MTPPRPILVGAVAYDPKVVTIWEIIKAYFEDLEDIGKVDTVVSIGESAGLDGAGLRDALESGTYRQQVDDGIQWAREIGVTGVPTFVVADKWAVVGAQDYSVFESLMQKLGKEPRV